MNRATTSRPKATMIGMESSSCTVRFNAPLPGRAAAYSSSAPAGTATPAGPSERGALPFGQ